MLRLLVQSATALLLLSGSGLAGCSRDFVRDYFDVRLVELASRQPVADAFVYVRPAAGDHGETPPAKVDSGWPFVRTDGAGLARFRHHEGRFDYFVDTDGDGSIETFALNVPTTSELVLYLTQKQNDGRNEEPDDGGTDDPGDDSSVAEPLPVTGAAIQLNEGNDVTGSYSVTVSLAAENALMVGLSEDAEAFPDRVILLPYAPKTMFQLSFGQGRKTVYAMFFGAGDHFVGPVSDSITVRTNPPAPPLIERLLVEENPPGQSDFLSGLAGAVEAGVRVRVYADRWLERLLGEGPAADDGSFGPIDIQDGSKPGNVEKVWDYVYVTAVDVFGRESYPAWVTNDSTPPEFRRGQMSGRWVVDTLGQEVGNPGDRYHFAFSGSTEVAGGRVNLSALGISDIQTFTGNTFAYTHTLAPDLFRESSWAVTMEVWDAARNLAGWMESSFKVDINTIAPEPVVVTGTRSGNRKVGVYWDDPNLDSLFYRVTVYDQAGESVMSGDIPALEFRKENIYQESPEVRNCAWYTADIQVFDAAMNQSAVISTVPIEAAIPPPQLEAWGGVVDRVTDKGDVYFHMDSVPFASSYELNFAPWSSPPFAYTTPSGPASPMTFATLPAAGMRRATLPGLPGNERFYLRARAFDGDCVSVYGPVMPVSTKLRAETEVDGGSDFDGFGGALAWLGLESATGGLKLGVGASGIRTVELLTVLPWAEPVSLPDYLAPLLYDLPATPLAGIDWNADGSYSLLQGSPLASPGGRFLAGLVNVYAPEGTLRATLVGDVEGLQFGYAIADLGDLTGDGVSDFAVGGIGCVYRDCRNLDGDTTALEGPGRVSVYDGATLAVLRIHEGTPGVLFGAAVAGGVDLNGDGVGEYVIGAPGPAGRAHLSRVYVFDGATGERKTEIATRSASHRFGAALSLLPAGAGNDSGIVIGAPSESETVKGEVHMVPGSIIDDPEQVWTWTVKSALSDGGRGFGASVHAASNLSGDGAVVLAGAPGAVQGLSYGAGAVYVLDAATGRLRYEVAGRPGDGGLGYSLLVPPTTPSAGRSWLTGAPASTHGGYQSGRVYVFTFVP